MHRGLLGGAHLSGIESEEKHYMTGETKGPKRAFRQDTHSEAGTKAIVVNTPSQPIKYKSSFVGVVLWHLNEIQIY